MVRGFVGRRGVGKEAPNLLLMISTSGILQATAEIAADNIHCIVYMTMEDFMADTKIYHGTGNDLQSSILAAHKLYEAAARKADHSKDMFTTKVVTLGVETGGYALNTIFFADVQETPHSAQQKPSSK
jgi:hypothetical protein